MPPADPPPPPTPEGEPMERERLAHLRKMHHGGYITWEMIAEIERCWRLLGKKITCSKT